MDVHFVIVPLTDIHNPAAIHSYPQNMWISLCASPLHSRQALDLFHFSIAVQRLCFTMSAPVPVIGRETKAHFINIRECERILMK